MGLQKGRSPSGRPDEGSAVSHGLDSTGLTLGPPVVSPVPLVVDSGSILGLSIANDSGNSWATV